MCNIVLNDDLSIRSYFEKVLELVKSGEDFPVNLDEVWPLIYSDKGKAVRVLTGDNGFIKDIDYKVFTKNGKNPTGGKFLFGSFLLRELPMPFPGHHDITAVGAGSQPPAFAAQPHALVRL